MRWWRIAQRAPVEVKTHIHPATGGDFIADTFDLSESGMFLRHHSLDWRTASGNTKPQQLRIGTHCEVRLRLDNREYVDCSAQIVRHAEANGQYPKGYGLRFLNIEKIHQKTLREFIERTQNHSENQDYEQKAA